MAFCHSCGAENPASARFCDQCGTELLPVPNQAPPAQTPAPPAAAISAGPGTCPQCGAPAIPGEAFCDNCGASLLELPNPASTIPSQPTYPPPQPVTPPQSPVPPPPQPQPAAPPQPAVPPPPGTLELVQLVVQETSASIPLPATTEVIIGRSDPVSNYYPDIDLTTHGALQKGVGRRHMRLFVQGGQLYVEDLDSTNGTFLNNQRLAPRTPQPVNHNDDLCIGALMLQVRR